METFAETPAESDRVANALEHSITWEDDVWRGDPFDVDQVHLNARVKFKDVMARLRDGARQVPRMLLFHGQSGAGKTHLVRALRTHVHGLGNGYFGYAQMTPDVADYAEYFLRRLVNALEKPYAPFALRNAGNGLRRLSDAMISDQDVIDADSVSLLQDGDFSDADLAGFISEIADGVMSSPRFADADIDLNVARALLYLQRNDPRVDQRVRQYLYGRQLNNFSHASVAALEQNTGQDRAFEIIEALGRIMWQSERASLVMCIDQVEDLRFYEDPEDRFQRAVRDLIQIANRTPSAVILISCLSDFYAQVRDHLPQSFIDRIEQAGPVLLAESRTPEEARQIIGARIAGALEPDVLERPERVERCDLLALDHFGENFFSSVAGTSTRKLLEIASATWRGDQGASGFDAGEALCGEHPSGAGGFGNPLAHDGDPSAPVGSGGALQQLWERHLSQFTADLDGDDETVRDLLLSAIDLHVRENALPPLSAQADDTVDGVPSISVDVGSTVNGAGATGRGALPARVYVCNRASQGGALKKQIDKVLSEHPGGPMIVVRASAFPPTGKRATGAAVRQLQMSGAHRIQVQMFELSHLAAATSFDAQQRAAPGYVERLRTSRPLDAITCLPQIRAALGMSIGGMTSQEVFDAPEAVTPSAVLADRAVTAQTAPGAQDATLHAPHHQGAAAQPGQPSPAHRPTAGVGDGWSGDYGALPTLHRAVPATSAPAVDPLPPLPALVPTANESATERGELGHAPEAVAPATTPPSAAETAGDLADIERAVLSAPTAAAEQRSGYDPFSFDRLTSLWSGRRQEEDTPPTIDATAVADPANAGDMPTQPVALAQPDAPNSGVEVVGNAGDSFNIGCLMADRSTPVDISKSVLKRHAAMLGGSGSGKTTLALTVVEQLLMSGVPVVLIDRKGDLCSYARNDVWSGPKGESEIRAGMREELSSMIDVAVYTPGRTSGRPIGITLLPGGINELPEHEQQELANVSAAAIGDMLHLKNSATHQRQRGILAVALKILGSRTQDEVTLSQLISMLENDDEELVEMTQRMDPSGKLRRDLIGQLDALRHRNWALFEGGGEPLSMESLLGRGAYAPPENRTRLSVVYTGFLGDNENILFWVSQFLTEALRFCQRNPNDELQAVLLFDEADLYIPANGRPATSEPLQSLLKRARSAGVGIVLATQSPGDLDYRSRDQITSWFIGRVREDTALRKLRAAFAAESGIDPVQVLPNQTVGEFHLIQEGNVTPLKSAMSLIKADQVPFDRIEQLAQQTRGRETSQLKLDI